FISEEMGVSKPSPEYFDRVVEAVGSADRSEYLVIGDSLTSDITGGKNSGIDTCWYNPGGEENDKGPIPTYTVKSYGEITDLLK
ncbi:MAG: HAD-IA family hydrolase, partial [Clostridia bacterium]|nr:HAD-IA family hydrolase [Clostridia bacterium]